MFATTLTLSTASTVYNLYTLWNAVEPGVVPSASQIIVIAGVGNTGNVYLGDSTVSDTVYGAQLPATGTTNFNAQSFNGLGMESIYLVGDAASQKVTVIAQRI